MSCSLFLVLAFLFGVVYGFSGCSTQNGTVDCEALCDSVAGTSSSACSCDVQRSRCACRADGAALHKDGKCLSIGPTLNSQLARCGSMPEERGARAIFVIAVSPSPELHWDHLSEGSPSASFLSVIRWCSAKALGLHHDDIAVAGAKLVTAHMEGLNFTRLNEGKVGFMFFDLEFDLCPSGVALSVKPEVFESRFIQAAQSFAGFEDATMRLLWRLDDSFQLEYNALSLAYVPPTPPSNTGDSKSADSLTLEAEESTKGGVPMSVWWFGFAALLTLLVAVVILASQRFYHSRRSKRDCVWLDDDPSIVVVGRPVGSARSEGDRDLAGPDGGRLASVTKAFQATRENFALLVAAGLEDGECLQVVQGDLVEVVACGEGWAYCHVVGEVDTGRFGYLPENCLLYIDGNNDHATAPSPPAGTDEPTPPHTPPQSP